MMPDGLSDHPFLVHLEALRRTLLRMFGATALLYPLAYFLTPAVIQFLTHWCIPPELGPMHFFSPMEVFWVQLKLALVLALILAYPWNCLQAWKFLLPALYRKERNALAWWMFGSTILFAGGVAFCIGVIMPLLMRFSASFASQGLQPLLGLSAFLLLTGWLSLAFGLMFQTPIAVLLAVHFQLVSIQTLRHARPYVVTIILVLAAILTPPDVVSQILLALPTWLLFELGILLGKFAQKNARHNKEDRECRAF